jgi:exodeoxyribonuclease-3
MKLATFNINGIKARIDALPAWLAAAQPDVVCLQEIKSVDEGFPREVFEAMGYRVETHGQKSFNGVAILSKLPLEDVTRGLPGDDADEQARWIEATVIGRRPIRVCGLYLPNGNPAPGPKYDYKLAWMSRMEARAKVLLAQEEPTVFCGDYNVIPQDTDAAKPMTREQFDPMQDQSALAHLPPKQQFRPAPPVIETPEAQVVNTLKSIEARLNEMVP